MKKKMIMVAIFVGALSLGSCVENTESASVEGVRNAKTEQLKSLATLNNANAEAALILAKAEAAIKEATAEGLRIANELEGIELEVAKAGLSIRLDIEKAEREAELKRAQAALESAKAALITAMDQVTIAEKQRVQTLLSEADAVLGRINSNRMALINTKFEKAGLEAGLDGVKASQEKTITAQNRIIATSEALIAEYSKYNKLSKDDALKAANEAEANAKELDKLSTAATNVETDAIAKETAAKKLVDESVYLKNAGTNTKPEVVASSVVEYTYSDGTYGATVVSSYTKFTADISAMNAAVNKADRDLTIARLALKDATKALADKKLEDIYKDAVTAVADAKKAYNEATTTADKIATRQALDAAELALKGVTQVEEDAVKDATNDVKTLTVELKLATDKLGAVTNNEVEYTALVKAWEAAMQATTGATIAADKAGHDYTVKNTLASSLRGIATATVDIATLILDEKEIIADAKAVIAETKDIDTREELITEKEREIAKLEQKLKVDEAAYADYMALIKAIIEAGK